MGSLPSTPPPTPPSPEEYERLKRAAGALEHSPEVKAERARQARTASSGDMQKYLRYTGLGLQFVATMGLPILGGYALDSWLGLLSKFPVFLLVGALLGIVTAMWSVIRAVGRMEGEDGMKP